MLDKIAMNLKSTRAVQVSFESSDNTLDLQSHIESDRCRFSPDFHNKVHIYFEIACDLDNGVNWMAKTE